MNLRHDISVLRMLGVTLCLLLGQSGFADVLTRNVQTDSGQDVLEEVRVVAQRLSQGVDGSIEPEISYDESSIRTLAVSSLAELLEELGPELGSGRGRGAGPPVVLVNGQRVASFREVRTYPPEAIKRVEIYPEEVALQYGFRADQKVINFVLKDRFQATNAVVAGGGDVQGGGETVNIDMGFLRLRGGHRFNLNAEFDADQPLHDSDRSVPGSVSSMPAALTGNVFNNTELDPSLSALVGETVTAATLPVAIGAITGADLIGTANQPEQFVDARLRTLRQERRTQNADFGYALPITDRISGVFSAGYSRAYALAEQGGVETEYQVSADHPNTIFANDVQVRLALPKALERAQRTEAFDLTATLNANLLGWSLNWINAYSRNERDIWTDQNLNILPFADLVAANLSTTAPYRPPSDLTVLGERDVVDSRDVSSRLLLRGVAADTSRGPLNVSVSLAWRSADRNALTISPAGRERSSLSRDISEARFSLDMPLLDSARWGELALNGNLEMADYSDFGVLEAVGGGFTWRPHQALRITTSWTQEEGAPSTAQLADPRSSQPNRRVFDFSQGVAGLATVITGGNPDLRADMRKVWSVGVRVKPFDEQNLTLSLNYVDSKTDDPVQRFPNPSAELERLFPERFMRNAEGRLLAYDSRAINLHRERYREVRWGLRYSRSVGTQRLGRRPGPNAGGDAGGRAERKSYAGRNWRDGRRAADVRGGRVRFSAYHTFTLRDELTWVSGLPAQNYVGVNSGNRRRGGSEHEVTLRGSYAFQHLTVRLNVRWLDATESESGSIYPIRYDALARTDLEMLYTFQPHSSLAQRIPLLRFVRAKLAIDNVFNEKPRVTDIEGLTPAGFEADELAPLGRTATLELRRLFR